VADAYAVRAKELGIENRAVVSAINALLSLGVVGRVAAQAEGKMVAAGAQLGSAAATEADLVTLWRAVKAEELADIRATGSFRNLGSAEGKYFSSTAEGAASYAKQASRAWPQEGTYTLVRTEISRSLLTPEMTATVDQGRIPAVVVSDALLPRLRPTILDPIPSP
jgi:filamentous hemagglutinin